MQRWILKISYSMLIAGFACCFSTYGIYAYAFYVFSGVIYIILSMYGMVLFGQRMYALTKLRQTELNEYIDTNQQELMLNKDQLRILNATTKYITLLSIAMASTWITILVWLLMAIALFTGRLVDVPLWIGFVVYSVQSIDAAINIICLYLQFRFNKVYYDRYCLCCGNCCVNLFTKMILKGMRQSAIEISDWKYSPPSIYKDDKSEEEI